jgi:hypothetical protein
MSITNKPSLNKKSGFFIEDPAAAGFFHARPKHAAPWASPAFDLGGRAAL